MFDKLPTEVICHILNFVSDNDVANFRSVSKGILFFSQNVFLKKTAQKLLTHVVKGEEEQVVAVLEKNPCLLLRTSERKDYSEGRTIKQAAFEAALSANDDIMAKKMIPFFDKIQKIAPGEALRQFKRVFPEGVEAHDRNLQEQAYDFKPLIEDIINGNEEKKINAISRFQEHMKRKRVVTEGAHFNPYDLINAYQAYVDNYKKFQKWHERNLFWKNVIGSIQRNIPANFAQVFCTGLYHFVCKEKAIERSLKIDKYSMFYSESLGVNHAIRCRSSSRASIQKTAPVNNRTETLSNLIEYVMQKHAKMCELELELFSKVCVTNLS